MHIRTAAAATAGTLAVLALPAPAAPTDTRKADSSFSKSDSYTRPTSTTMKRTFTCSLHTDGTDYANLTNAGTWHLEAEAVSNDQDF